jgi:tartrate-resistant acid phosphatase type 5
MIAAAIVLLAGAAAPPPSMPEVSLKNASRVLRIAVVGDVGDGTIEVAKGMAKLHAAAPFDAIAIPGDNFYPCSPKSLTDPLWQRLHPLIAMNVPLIMSLGNHDYCGGGPDIQVKATGVVPHWVMPARQYVARNPLADIVVLDTTPVALGKNSDAIAALHDGFATSTSTWRIVLAHHPPLSSGYHGYVTRKERSNVRSLVAPLRREKVDLFIGGHEHHQELLRWKPNVLVSGAGSEPIPPMLLRPQTVWPTSLGRESVGFAILEITRLEIRVRFFDGKGAAISDWMRVAKR